MSNDTETRTLTDFLLARIAEDEAETWHREDCTSLEWGSYADCDCGLPARVLAECEAKRRIVDLHPVTVRREWRHDGWGGTTGCDTLRALALPYADHPDSRDEWRP